MNETVDAVDKRLCNGCRACISVCPSHAIVFAENSEGFFYPHVETGKCTSCGLCSRVCSLQYRNQNESPKCYALMADDKTRQHSSSGGCFSLLAADVLERGGYVCGAAFDEKLEVRHILIHEQEDLEKVRTSKYVQSNVGTVYRDIKNLLDQKTVVLFVGTPCQVAGLKGFLRKDYQNLYTVDLVCNGVPSLKVLRKYLSDHCAEENIRHINFRDKKYGWNYNFNFKVTGVEGIIFEKPFRECMYLEGFNQGLSLRKSCYFCRFQTVPRVGDLTLGDFWEVDSITEGADDGKGTSLVLANNVKGEELLGAILPNSMLFKKVDFEKVPAINVRLSYPTEPHPNRERFFRDMERLDFDENVLRNLDNRYDVAILNFWWTSNYGAILTAYALQQIVERLGYSSRLVKYIFDQNPDVYYNRNSDRFARKHLKTTQFFSSESELTKLNHQATTFIVGSDQVFRYEYARDSFFLNFANHEKRKLAISASFGVSQFNCPRKQWKKYRFLLSRFHHISVRELSGVSLLKNFFRIEAQQVLDPVFVLDKEKWDSLTKESSLQDGGYVLSYILDNDADIQKRINDFAKEKSLNVMTIDESRSVEDWLYLIKNAEYVFTDSFHGACFSLIFGKRFKCLLNVNRGQDRFETLMQIFRLPDGLFVTKDQLLGTGQFALIDYREVEEIVTKEKSRFEQNLKNALRLEPSVSLWTRCKDAFMMSCYFPRRGKRRFKLQAKKNYYHVLSLFSRGTLQKKIHEKYLKYKRRLNEEN